jgi:hypothetical protein
VKRRLGGVLLAACALAVLASPGPPARTATVSTPSEFLKMSIGADGVLANYEQIVSYWKAVDAASDRITLQDLGPTTMGHRYVAAVITSPENQAKLDYYRNLNNRLYDPRTTTDDEAQGLIAGGKTIVAIQLGIHSDEVGAPQLSLELAHRFATEDTLRMREVLDQTIIILSPSQNPDGAQMVAEWNAKMLGTRFEGGPLPFLYHKYVGHDNNRDWYMFTQKESQISVGRIWNYWHPQISYDLHQMSVDGARMFIPPYVDPCDPNVDPILRARINELGSAMAAELTSQGRDGVVIHAMYDMWTPARAYVNYHGGVRILTEAASARLASPVLVRFDQLTSGIGYDAARASWNFPRPWRGGFWRLRDIMDYEHAAVDALLDHAAHYRSSWLSSFYRVNKNAIGRVQPETGEPKPYAVVVSASQPDPMSAFKMLWVLQFADVEISRARTAFVADGRPYPAGSHVILLAQPASAFAKTLTEVQHYPDLREYPGGPPQRPYDATAFTMPLLMGVNAVQVLRPFTADLELLTSPIAPPPGTVVGGRASHAYVLAHDSAGLLALGRLAKAGVGVRWALSSFKAAGRQFEAGSILVPITGQQGVHEAVAALAAALPVTIYAVNEPVPEGGVVRLPRIGLYKSYVPVMDEGWTRWLLEQFDLPYTSLENKDVKAGALRARYDVIVLPDQAQRAMLDGYSAGSVPPEYVGGLGEAGVGALRAFAEDGGTLVALASASLFAIERLHLPVDNVLSPFAGRGDEPGGSADFYAPGSIVRTRVDTTHPVAFGSPAESIAWFEQSPAFRTSGNARAIVTFPPAGSPLLSGWLLGGQRLSGTDGVVEAPVGKGRVILFGFQPQFRAQTWATFGLFFNSLYYSTLESVAR